MSTTQSILLYGAEIWAKSLEQEVRRKVLAKVQRTAALRISSAYRTVSEKAILVISSSIPIDILAEERRKSWAKRNLNHAVDTSREDTFQQWQVRWAAAKHGRWTALFMPNLLNWAERQIFILLK